jgi:hypothetical protein
MSSESKFLQVDLKLNENAQNYSTPIVCQFPITKPSIDELNSNDRPLHLFQKNKSSDDYILAGEKGNVLYEGKSKVNSNKNSK